MKFVSYSVMLIAISIATAALVVGFSLWLVPMTNHSMGDLARIGWHSNNHWAPKMPFVTFDRPLYSVGAYDRYHDVHVLGDSFSIDPRRSWVNYVAAAGLSIRVQYLRKNTGSVVDELLNGPVFRADPPKVVVYEVVERELLWRLQDAESECSPNRPSTPKVILRRGPPSDPQARETRQPMETTLSDEQVTYARDFLIASVRERFKPSKQVFELSLSLPRFSNVNANRILILAGDSYKTRWTESEIQHFRCALRYFRDRVQSNGKTVFVAMLVPDKLSIYHDDVVERSLPVSVIPKIMGADLLGPRLDIDLRAAVTQGRLDVYLPNDTHWGAAGAQVAAQSLLDLLQVNDMLAD